MTDTRPETTEPADFEVGELAHTPHDQVTSAASNATSARKSSDPLNQRTAFRRAVGVGLAAFVVSRLCVVAGTAVRASQVVVDQRKDGEPEDGAVTLMTGVLTSWDGAWYLELIRKGYPESIPANITYAQEQARAAFFPMYPGAVDAFDTVLPGGDTFAALLLNLILGAVSVVLIGVMAYRIFDTTVAARAMVIYAIFPGSFVLSFAYAEALFIVFAASCLLLLLDEQWLLAGLAAALASGTRPNGVAVVVACLVASFLAVRHKRQWSSLVSVALAPVGFVGFQMYVDAKAGETGAWFRVQREAWSEGASFGATAVENTFGFIASPFDSPADALTFMSMLSLGIMAYSAWKRRLPLPWIAFSAVVIALMLFPETVTARPRFVFTAFPLFIAVAAMWPDAKRSSAGERSPDDLSVVVAHGSPVRSDAMETALPPELRWESLAWATVLIMSGAGLAVLTNLYGVFGAIP